MFKSALRSSIYASMITSVVISLVMFFGLPQPVLAGGLLSEIRAGYASIKDVKGSFSQVSKIKELDKKMSYSGVFSIKIPKKMYWRYDGTDLQEVYVNADTIIVYQKKLNQAIRRQFNENTLGQTPIALLSGLKDIDKDYNVKEFDGYVRLTPKGDFLNIRYFDLYPSEGRFPIGKIVLIDKNGNEVEITLKDVLLNTGIKDGTFTFVLPKGVTLVDN
ncbi:MAG: outer-membrane lipoprotein carrier protein LolA [Nitrospirae bacterium]|nr:outer-membrane lipoprotein carrier protein LolA [Nitrospirota bacterium]